MYRLICSGTVEEKIVRRANQKNKVQQLVMTGGPAAAAPAAAGAQGGSQGEVGEAGEAGLVSAGEERGDVFDADEVVSLLLDDAELEAQLKRQQQQQQQGGAAVVAPGGAKPSAVSGGMMGQYDGSF